MLTFDRNGEILEKSGTIFYIDRPFEGLLPEPCVTPGTTVI